MTKVSSDFYNSLSIFILLEFTYKTYRIRFLSADRVSCSDIPSFCGGSGFDPESNYIILKGIQGWKLDPSDTKLLLGFYGGKGVQKYESK